MPSSHFVVLLQLTPSSSFIFLGDGCLFHTIEELLRSVRVFHVLAALDNRRHQNNGIIRATRLWIVNWDSSGMVGTWFTSLNSRLT
jgi:hypothetical protein